jgi:hypothetical protein
VSCTDIGGTDVGGDCTLNSVFDCNANLVVDIPGNLTIGPGAGIDCTGTDGNGMAGSPGFNLTLNVTGDLILADDDGVVDPMLGGFLLTDGGSGGAGGTGATGFVGAAAGNIDIDVCGTVTLGDFSIVRAQGGPGGPGGSNSGAGAGGPGQNGAAGGIIDIDADEALTQDPTGIVDAAGGAGGSGGAGGTSGGTGGAAGDAGIGGAVLIFSCETIIEGFVGADGGAGGSGGTGGTGGTGGRSGSGANAGAVTVESGADLILQATSILSAAGGNEGAPGGGAVQGPTGNDVAGNGGAVTTNNCPEFSTSDLGTINVAAGNAQGAGIPAVPGTETHLEDAPCCPCAIEITKNVALDDNCDGTADGAFSPSVLQDQGECVVYEICVTNTSDGNPGDHPQVIEGVLVDDNDIGITGADFGDLDPGEEVCKLVPSEVPATDCPGDSGDLSDDNCVCEDVVGDNTVEVAAAACAVDGSDACDNTDPPPNPGPDSICEDTATVACNTTSSTVTTTSSTTTTSVIVECPLDHFKCYKTRTDGSFVPRDVTLVDQFESTSALVEKPSRLCNPANKNNEGITDPTAHLMCYDINQATPFTPRHVLVNNQFGEQELVVTKPFQLCNPATKDEVGNFEDLNLDHMKCYRVRRAVGSPRVNPTITVQDQFETRTAQVFRPHILCNPVDKNGSGIQNRDCHLVCYRLRASLPIFRSQPVTIEDQFSAQNLDALRGVCGSVDYVCLPSSKTELD